MIRSRRRGIDMTKNQDSRPPQEPTYRPREQHGGKLGEARAEYLATADEDEGALRGTTRLSSKNQITIPAAMVRYLDMTAGDEIGLELVGNAIEIQRLPRTPEEWGNWLMGAMAEMPEWQTKEKIDTWIRTE